MKKKMGTAASFALSVLALGALVALLAPTVAEAQGYQFCAVTPCRVVDTRAVNPQQPAPLNTTPTLVPGLWPEVGRVQWTGPTDPISPTNFKLRGVSQFDGTGNCGIPTAATAVAVNVTIVQPLSDGDVRIWPYGGSMPLVATISITRADTALANGAIVPMPPYNAANPDISIRFTVNPKTGGANVVMDVTGYFQ